MKKLSTNQLTKLAIVAAIYAVLTVGFSYLSFGPIQLRFSEILNLLVFFNPLYMISIVVGCLIANLFSPFGIYDVVFGTLATFLSVYAISKTKNLFVATLWPTIFNAIIIGAQLAFLIGGDGFEPVIFSSPFFDFMTTVGIGEFIVVTIAGYPIMKSLRDRESFRGIIEI